MRAARNFISYVRRWNYNLHEMTGMLYSSPSNGSFSLSLSLSPSFSLALDGLRGAKRTKYVDASRDE